MSVGRGGNADQSLPNERVAVTSASVFTPRAPLGDGADGRRPLSVRRPPPRDWREPFAAVTAWVRDRTNRRSFSEHRENKRSENKQCDNKQCGKGLEYNNRGRANRWRASVGVVIVVAVVVAVALVVVIPRRPTRASARVVKAGVQTALSSAPAAGLPLTGANVVASGGAEPAAAANLSASGPSAAAGVFAPAAIGVTASTIAVHAAGAVVEPGVYVFAAGARVDDVLATAGGPASDANLDAVNLAAPVHDGDRIYFPRRGEESPPIVSVGASPGAQSSPVPPVVDLNTASAVELDALPGVGPATASAIIEFRTRNGRFRSVSQLLDVPGIGDAKLAAMRARVRV